MKSTLISKEKNVVKFSIEFTAEEFEAAQVKAYNQSKGKFAVDGFRKGKAPKSIIERYYGEGVFFEDAINELLQDGYVQALDELDLDVVSYPEVEPYDPKKGEGLTIEMSVEVYPEVNVQDYKGVEIEKIEAEVTEEDIDEEIESLRRRNSRMVLVDRPVQNDDMVLVDYEGSVDGVNFEGGTAERYPLKIGSGTFIPGFEEQLIGAKAGEPVEVKVTFPEEYHADDLAGKEAIFKCLIHEIKETEVPELDDEFVKDVSECDTLEELRAQKKEELIKSKETEAENDMKNKIIEKIYEATDIDIPDGMLKSESESMMGEFDQQLRAQGMSLDQYLDYLGKSKEDFQEEIKPEAFKKLKTRMLITAIAKEEGIEVTSDEISEEIERIADQYSMEVDQVKGMLGAENLEFMAGDIRMKKAIDLIYKSAVIK